MAFHEIQQLFQNLYKNITFGKVLYIIYENNQDNTRVYMNI